MSTVADVARACGLPWLSVEVGAPPDVSGGDIWHRLRALTEPAALRTVLDRVLDECDGQRAVATAFVAARFAWPLARLAVVPAVTWRCALVFVPSAVWLRLDERGLITGVRVEDPVLLGAARDAWSDVVDARAVVDARDVAPVYARVTTLAVDGYRPVVDGLRAVGRLGERALWGQMADALVATVGEVLSGSGDPTTAGAHADLLLRAADPPLWVRSEFARVERGGAPALAWRRGSCCLAYRLPWYGVCTGCPLQSRSDWLAVSTAAGDG